MKKLQFNYQFDTRNLVKVKLNVAASAINETLTRLGFGKPNSKTVNQTCFLIKIKKDWYIVHFKECYGLIGNNIDWKDENIQHRNTVARLLQEWGNITILNEDEIDFSYGRNITTEPAFVFKIKHENKEDFNLKPKYYIKPLRELLKEV